MIKTILVIEIDEWLTPTDFCEVKIGPCTTLVTSHWVKFSQDLLSILLGSSRNIIS